ncbi:MAG: filamentous hemagglutinin N-terminal domain-containing protein [Cyanobacteria bacterium P01_A01_bin.83]
MYKAFFSPLQVSLCTVGYFLVNSGISLAQVTSDGTSGISPAQVTSDGTVNTQVNQNGSVAEITGGETREGNLFHSFQDFSVSTGKEAFFDNANDIANIFSRVTGGNMSKIDGLIRANGSANLFLINPAGILFGENASLDIGGSFYGSSADSILFENGEFSAVDNLEQPILTVNAPIGLGFRDEPGDITNRSNTNNVGLEVSSGANIGLIGGNINLEGGQLTAPGGIIELGGLSQAGVIGISDEGSLSFPDNVAKANITLSEGAVVDVTSEVGGLISANANTLELRQGSTFQAEVPTDTVGNAGNINIFAQTLNMDSNAQLSTINEGTGNAGNVTLEIAEDITLNNGASIVTQTAESGSGLGNAGDVSITANSLELRKSNIFANNRKKASSGSGNSGSINIETEASVSLINNVLSTSINPDELGDSGDITIKSPQVSLEDNAVISASSSGGNIGQIKIDADNISIDNFSLITASSRSADFNDANTSTGGVTLNSEKVSLTNGGIIDVSTANQTDGGSINITADTLEIRTGGVLQTTTEGTGNAGTVDLTISDHIMIDGEDAPTRPSEFDFADDILNNREGATGIFANADQIDGNNNTRDAGEIDISSNTLKLDNNAQLSARNPGQGNKANGGTVTLTIADSVVIDNGSSINVEVDKVDDKVDTGGIGNAGNVNITANTFELLRTKPSSSRTIILAPNDGQGDSGKISIDTRESVVISNSTITSAITQDAAGNTGEIQIKSPEVSLTDNAIVSVSSSGNAEGGNINIISSDKISVDNFSLIAASSRNKDSRGSGNITLNSGTVTLSNGGVINATTDSEDNGGEITINAEILELFSGGVLQTATEGNGNAGNITLNISERIVLDGNNAPNRRSEFDFDDNILNALESRTGIFAGTTGVDSLPSTGGNIEINTDVVVALPNGNSDILANSQEGKGGAITINADSLLGIAEGNIESNSNDINASSGIEGLDGTVTINTPDISSIQGTTELQSNIVVPEQNVAQACRDNSAIASQNYLTIKGRGRIPTDPTLPLESENISINGKTIPTSTVPQPIETTQGKIQPARGIAVKSDGSITLTAYQTDNSGTRVASSQANCG